MPKDYTEQTIRDVYHDDYTDSDGYYQILFNSSRYLQARELTQLQTILQQQITRFADNIFQDGAAVTNASAGSGIDQASYVLIDTSNLGNESIQRYVGRILKGPPVTNVHGGLDFTVTFATASVEGTSFATLYGFYSSTNQTGVSSSDVQGAPLTFADGNSLKDQDLTPLTPLTVATRSSAPLSTGQGLLFTLQQSDFYAQGHFVYVEKQEIVISAYEIDVDVDVGFQVIQDIVTVEDNVSLYDNQGAVPNLASPGADRYRIRMLLTTKDAVADPLNFLPFAQVKGGFVTKVKTGNNDYNLIEDRMAARQFDTNGDFIVNPFGLSYQSGNTQSNLTMSVLGLSENGAATAFVDGYRLTQGFDSEYQILKPVSFTTQNNTTTTVAYRNFIPVSNTTTANEGLGEWPTAGDLRTQTQFKLFDNANLQIGTTRIKSLIRLPAVSDKGVQVHLYDVRMNSGKNFRNVETISAGSNAERMPVFLEGTSAFIIQPEINTSLFEIPGGRAKNVSDVRFSSQRQFIQQSNNSGVMKVDCDANNRFDNILEWIFINLEDDTMEIITTIVNSGQTATVTGLTADKPYCVFALATDLGASAKVKTFTRTGYEEWTSPNATADFVRTGGVKYDGVRLLDAYRLDTTTTPATQVVVSDSIEFDGGQRDNFYSPITIKRDGISGTILTIYVKMDYFEWSDGASAGDFFSVNSYPLVAAADSTNTSPKFSYSDIPIYTSGRNGAQYDLRNQFDFRSKLNPADSAMAEADRFRLPKDGAVIAYDIEWYNRRVDNVSLGYNPSSKEPEIRINSGVEQLDPTAPPSIPNEMILFSVNYGGNTISTTDMQVKTYSYKRFSMEDIGNIEKRVERLEETVSLTAIEQSAINLVELNSSGAIRSKTGFFVDDFTNGLSFTASPIGPVWQEDFALVGQTLLQTGETSYSIEPKNARAAVSLLFDSGGDLNAGGYEIGRATVYNKLNNNGNNNYKHVGDTIYLDYVDTLDSSLVNESISWKSGGVSYEEDGYYNVNPFNVFTGEGSLKLSPEKDLWLDEIRLPDINITQTLRTNRTLLPITNYLIDANNLEALQKQATAWNNKGFSTPWRNRAVIEINSVTATNEILTATDETVLSSRTNDRMVISYPFARSRPIFCKAQGLRPNTRYWPYFEGIDVSQWCHSLTETIYKKHLEDGDHLKTYQPVNVNILTHPDGSDNLVTNSLGERWYSFFLPNNASVPSNAGLSFTTLEEWAQWGREQQSLADASGSSIKNPTVYNNIGWKFKGGILNMKLLDVSPVGGQGADEANSLSRASMTYTCMGRTRITETTNRYTRTLTNTSQTVTTVSQSPKIYYYDPLAQSFTIDARTGLPGAFVTKVDVFLRKAPQTTARSGTQTAIPLQLQIRETEAGVPKGFPVTEQFRVYKSADDCYDVVNNINDLENLDDVLSNPVTFVFEEPVYLSGGVEYAIVLLAECDNYEAFISTTNALVLGKTTNRVNKQPASGSLFLSQNGNTWTPQQDQNMAYRIYTAKFKSEGNVNFYNSVYPKFVHNQLMMSTDATDLNRFRVNQFAHGLGVGDSVALTGLSPTKNYLGLLGNQILNKDLKVNEADAGGYFVNVPAAGAFTSAGAFGETQCQSNTAFNFDRAMMNFVAIDFQGTSVEYQGDFMSGNSLSKLALSAANDARFVRGGVTTINNLTPIVFDKPMMLGDSDMQLNPQDANGPSIVLSANMKSTLRSTFGNATPQQQLDGYVSDVSPIIDLQKCNFTMQNFQIDNQVLAIGDPATDVQNKPYFFVPETNPQSGSSPSKQITKPVVLDLAASGIKVFVDINKPPSASFDLYYRLANGDDDIYGVSWIIATPDNNPPDDKFDALTYDPLNLFYSEYRYLLGGVDGSLDAFTSFQLKVVMKTTNTCEIPVIGSIRAIALI